MLTYFQSQKRSVNLFNLDPAAEKFEYEPTIGINILIIDIRELITLEDVMDELGLGPNGGLIYCLEFNFPNFRFLLKNQDWLEEQIADYNDDYLIIDCPGNLIIIFGTN